MIKIIYTTLPMREQTENTTFSCNDDQCKTLQLYWNGVKGIVHLRSTDGVGHIPGIFSLHAAYSALRHFFSGQSVFSANYSSSRPSSYWQPLFIALIVPGFSVLLDLGEKETLDWDNKYQPSGAGGTRSPPATPQRLQCRTACHWAPKWLTGSGKVSTPRFLGILSNFR